MAERKRKPTPPAARPPAAKPFVGKILPAPGAPKRVSSAKQADIFAQAFTASETTAEKAPLDAVSAPVSGIEVFWADAKRVADNPFQPRSHISVARLQGLIKSMNEQGQLQSVVGRRRGRQIQLALGHRRRNAVLVGANAGSQMPNPDDYVGKIRIELRDLTDQQMADAGWDENEEREDVSIFDHAHRYEQLRALAPGQDGAEVSWEDLVIIREKLGKPLKLKARSIRRIVEVLRLPDDLQERLSDINLAARSETGDDEEKFVGIKEKHCRALLMLQPLEKAEKATPEQLTLLAQIEEERISSNEAVRRAKALRGEEESEDTDNSTDESSSSPSDSSSSESLRPGGSLAGASGGGSGGSGVQVTQGVGMAKAASASSRKSKKDQKNESQDIATALIQPAAKNVAEAARLWPELRVGGDYQEKVEAAVADLEDQIGALKNTIKRGGK